MTSPNGRRTSNGAAHGGAASTDAAHGDAAGAGRNGAGGPRDTELVDVDRLMRLRARLRAISAALDDSDPVTRRRVTRRVEHIAALAPDDLDAAEDALDRLEQGMSAKGLLH